MTEARKISGRGLEDITAKGLQAEFNPAAGQAASRRNPGPSYREIDPVRKQVPGCATIPEGGTDDSMYAAHLLFRNATSGVKGAFGLPP